MMCVVVSEMSRHAGFFMCAGCRCSSPDRLKREKHNQADEKKSAH